MIKIFIQKPEFTDKIYRAYIFGNGKSIVSSSMKSIDDAVEKLQKETNFCPLELNGLVEEYKGEDK